VETDGVDEAIEGQIRMFITTAEMVGREMARHRTEQMRQARIQSERDAERLQQRLDAEREAALVQLARIGDRGWYEQVTPQELAYTYQLAEAWAGQDRNADAYRIRMKTELKVRYGIDPESLRSEDAVQAAMQKAAERERGEAAAERTEAKEDERQARDLMNQADHDGQHASDERAAAEQETDPQERLGHIEEARKAEIRGDENRQDGQVAYDSAERRQQFAANLEARGIAHEIAVARCRADAAQAKPATQAVGKQTRVKRARKAKPRTPQLQRTDRGR
jgi:hypothetical protein